MKAVQRVGSACCMVGSFVSRAHPIIGVHAPFLSSGFVGQSFGRVANFQSMLLYRGWDSRGKFQLCSWCHC
jgi:hypothetical protein